MAIPVLYWMLECTGCGTRRVVRDQWLKFLGSSDPYPAEGEGFGGPPLPERYRCLSGCRDPMRAIGSIFRPDDREMWLHRPHELIEMDAAQREEWSRLIQATGVFPE